MKEVYLVHCWSGTIHDGWYSWVSKILEHSHIKVHAIVMPNPDVPIIEKWVDTLEKTIENLNENVYFIGHSIGCQTIMRYLQRKKITKIGGILFVAPWIELSLKAIETEEDKTIAQPWLTEPIYYEKIKRFTENITCIFSDDDYFVPISQKRFFEGKLNAHTIVVHEKGHISMEDGVYELPELLIATGKMLGVEFLEIVDQDGEFTGEILEKELAHDRNLLHNEVSVFVVNDKKEVLLQKRSPNKRFKPNKWGLCSGHVDIYESLEQAVIREIFEEIGLKAKKEDLHSLQGRILCVKETNSHFTYLYYAKTSLKEEDFVIQKEELSEVKWVPILEVYDWIERGFTSFDTSYVSYLELVKKELERE